MLELWLMILLAMIVGIAHAMALRQLTGRLMARPDAVMTLVMFATLMRFVPVLMVVLGLVVLGVGPAIGALVGYWLGRNVVLIASLRWRNR